MSKKFNLFYDVLTIVLTLIAVYFSIFIYNKRYSDGISENLIYVFFGFIIAFFLCIFIHEIGHYFFGKLNKFELISMKILFIKIYKEGKKTRFSFCRIGDNLGATEMIAKDGKYLSKRFALMTFGGILFTLLSVVIGIVPFIFYNIPSVVFCLLIMFFPIGCYNFFGNVLPITENGYRNDGAVLIGVIKKDDEYLVSEGLLKIQIELFSGKSPSEIEKDMYFDLPQLPEDNLNFIILLTYRYMYYLDLKDYENAKKIMERMLSLEEYMPKDIINIVKVSALYCYCTFDKNEEKADELMYEMEKYLNNINNAENVRTKLCYLLNILGEKDENDIFKNKLKREIEKIPIEGLKKYELKLMEDLK